MVVVHAGHIGGGVVPPLLLHQKTLVDGLVGHVLPLRSGEASVLRQRIDTRLAGPPTALDQVRHQFARFVARLERQFTLLAWRETQVYEPIHIRVEQ